jgi:uncharacterized OB-fold protein
MAGYAKPLPKPDALTAPFWAHAKARELAVQHCPQCNDLRFPPTQACPACLAEGQDWKVVSGAGVVLHWVHFHRAYWPGFEAELPYNVCAIRLVEGPILLSNVVGVPREALREGMKVRAVFQDVTPDVTLPKFAPA